MSQFAAAVKEFPVLQTARLTLRLIREDDAPDFFDQLSVLPHTSAWLDSYQAQSLDNTRNAIRSYNNQFKRSKTTLPWALVNQEDRLLGFLMLSDIQNRSKAELAYWLGRDYWGQGLMTESVLAVISFAFSQLGMHRIYATTHPRNAASQSVLKRAGFQKEGVLRQHGRLSGEWTDAIMFGLLSTDLIPFAP